MSHSQSPTMENILADLQLGQPGTPSYERQVKACIQAAESNLARIESQIRDLTRLRDREEQLISALKPLVAPIRRVPPELLLEIFHAAFKCDELGWLKQVLAIASVCGHWRRLACTCPRLWNRLLKVDIQKAPSEEYLVIAKTFLERSGVLPIPVGLHHEHEEAAPLVEYLYTLAPRWVSLYFDSSHIGRLCDLPTDALTTLKSLTVHSHMEISASSPLQVFLGAPHLRHVFLNVWNLRAFPMPWSQLTTLTIHCLAEPAQHYLEILVQCTNVVTVEFMGLRPWSERPPSFSQPVRLEKIQKFALEFVVDQESEEQPIMPFFSCLALPSLTTLELNYECGTSWSSPDFTLFQHRSPKIEEFKLHGPDMDINDLISLVREFSNLVELNLHYCGFDGLDTLTSILELFQCSQEIVPVTPRLRRLSILSAVMEDLAESVLEKTISSRWWTGTPPTPAHVARWESIMITGGKIRTFSQGFVKMMAQFRRDGLRVVVG
ncbi:hypothetical protein FB45DRAFT_298211 [Roridomyces roridus]|uniref:F-box domain-containing protein n=1 Tax=Roridomyces roridus TaxID=1738132 RepID=A0AAD7CCG3_9AGAR|nr:hypothetical protein FB45DRAFT_298211 [Roridomyces roridus]